MVLAEASFPLEKIGDKIFTKKKVLQHTQYCLDSYYFKLNLLCREVTGPFSNL